MLSNAPLPFVPALLRRHPAVVSAAAAATGFIRRMSFKPYRPAVRRRELALAARLPDFHGAHCPIFREKGVGSTPTIVIAGFVPDATEVAEFQRQILKRHGAAYYMNFPRNNFYSSLFYAQLADLIESLNKRGEEPVLFSISFGCGLVAGFLQRPEFAGLRIGGLVMVSPVLCTEDLVRPDGERTGGVRILESNLRRIFKADSRKADDVKRQMDRARRCFQALFEAGAENRVLTSRHLSIRGKIMDVLAKTSNRGGYERVLAMREFSLPAAGEPLFTGPTLALLAETEDNMLVPGSPTLAALRDRQTARQLFPNGTIGTVASSDAADQVAHASLIFHHHYYNVLLERWYARLTELRLESAV
jgi:hypothetical protein